MKSAPLHRVHGGLEEGAEKSAICRGFESWNRLVEFQDQLLLVFHLEHEIKIEIGNDVIEALKCLDARPGAGSDR
jgi:hypothetical protein